MTERRAAFGDFPAMKINIFKPYPFARHTHDTQSENCFQRSSNLI